MLADTFGRPLRFRVTPGQASDIASAPHLLAGRWAKAVIRSQHNRTIAIPHDAGIYKHRNQIE